jgi:transposase
VAHAVALVRVLAVEVRSTGQGNGVRSARVWQRLLGVERTVVEDVILDGDELVAHVRPRKGVRQRCGRCGRRGPWEDRGDGRRRWRSLDAGPVRVVLEADARRVNCPVHGPTVIQVPWVRHDVGHTYVFDDQVAWLAVHTSKTAVSDADCVAHGRGDRGPGVA